MKVTVYFGKGTERIDFSINQSKKKVTATTYSITGKKYAKWLCKGFPEELSEAGLAFFWIDCDISKISLY